MEDQEKRIAQEKKIIDGLITSERGNNQIHGALLVLGALEVRKGNGLSLKLMRGLTRLTARIAFRWSPEDINETLEQGRGFERKKQALEVKRAPEQR